MCCYKREAQSLKHGRFGNPNPRLGFFYVQDERYAAVAWMQRSGVVPIMITSTILPFSVVFLLWYDCKDAGGRAMHGAIAEWVVEPTVESLFCLQLSFRVLLTPLTYIHVGNKRLTRKKPPQSLRPVKNTGFPLL